MLPSSSLLARLVVVGVNHRSSSVTLRDRLIVGEAQLPVLLADVRRLPLAEAVVVSTCDRIEVWATDEAPRRAADALIGLLAARSGHSREEVASQVYVREGEAALRHVFAVASSLDSLVVGEPHILGQVRSSHRIAHEAGLVARELAAVLEAAYAAAKRVRSETAIAERPVSMAAVAVRISRDIHGDLSRCNGLLLGPGEMGELLIGQLRDVGLGRLVVASRFADQAEAAARRLSCHYVPFESLATALADADIVVAAVGTRRYLITAEMVTEALRVRRQRPVFVIDAAVPGDVEPAVNRLEGAFLYDLSDLDRLALEGRATREAAAQAARDIVDDEVALFLRRRAERDAAGAVTALRDRFEAVRTQVLSELRDVGPDEATRRLVNRLLHDPSEALRDMAGRQHSEEDEAEIRRAERLLRRLFRLSDDRAAADRDRGDDEEPTR